MNEILVKKILEKFLEKIGTTPPTNTNGWFYNNGWVYEKVCLDELPNYY